MTAMTPAQVTVTRELLEDCDQTLEQWIEVLKVEGMKCTATDGEALRVRIAALLRSQAAPSDARGEHSPAREGRMVPLETDDARHAEDCVWHRNKARGIPAFDCNCGAHRRKREEAQPPSPATEQGCFAIANKIATEKVGSFGPALAIAKRIRAERAVEPPSPAAGEQRHPLYVAGLIMERACSWFQIQEVAHRGNGDISAKARSIWESMQRWLAEHPHASPGNAT